MIVSLTWWGKPKEYLTDYKETVLCICVPGTEMHSLEACTSCTKEYIHLNEERLASISDPAHFELQRREVIFVFVCMFSYFFPTDDVFGECTRP